MESNKSNVSAVMSHQRIIKLVSFDDECFVQVNKESKRQSARSGAIISLSRYPSPGLCLVPYAALLPPASHIFASRSFSSLLPSSNSLPVSSYCFYRFLSILIYFSFYIVYCHLNYFKQSIHHMSAKLLW